MTRRQAIGVVAAVAIATAGLSLVSPRPALGFNPIKPICTVAGLVNGLAQKACSLVGGGGSGGSTATTALTLAAVVAWVVGGAKFALHETSHVLGETTRPQLSSTWFSSTYWRVAAVAAVLTLPFLFAAAVQALIRSDLSLLIRAALGYLPLALLAVAIAAPLTMLLLAASDQLSAVVSSAAQQQDGRFLGHAGFVLGSIALTISSPFVVFLVALLTAAGAIVLWMELLVREAAVYVIVLMLPLAFAAFVWPARRIWAIRSIELLVALILSKFAIVAVLSLGGAALAQGVHGGVTGLLAGAVLMALAAFAPWAMLRVIPLTEIASGAAASLGSGARTAALRGLQRSDAWASEADHHWASKTAQMRHETEQMRHPAKAAGSSNGAIPSEEGLDADRGVGAPLADRPPGEAESADPVARQSGPATATAGNPGTSDAWPAIDEERPAFDLTNPPVADGDTPPPHPEADDQA